MAAAAEERLLGEVELAAVDLALLDAQPEFLRGEFEQRRARYALENRRGHRRGDEDTPPAHGEAGIGALRDFAREGQEDRLVIIVAARLEHAEAAVVVVRPRLDARRHD